MVNVGSRASRRLLWRNYPREGPEVKVGVYLMCTALDAGVSSNGYPHAGDFDYPIHAVWGESFWFAFSDIGPSFDARSGANDYGAGRTTRAARLR